MHHIGVNVRWIAKCKYLNDQNIGEHSHPFFHYLYVLNGSGQIIIDGERFTFYRDHIYMVPIGVHHEFSTNSHEKLQVIEIKFDIEKHKACDTVSALPLMMRVDDVNIKHILELMLNEGITQDDYYSTVINLRFHEVLIRLLRGQGYENNNSINVMVDSKIYDCEDTFYPVIKYMRDNIDRPIDLETLADIACLEKSYFSKRFKDRFGDPPIKFLNHMRLAKSKDLLRNSDMNITQISYATGFQSLGYFSRFFTQREGVSPYEYRQRYRENIYIFVEDSRGTQHY